VQSTWHSEESAQCARIIWFNMQTAPSHQNNQGKYTHFSHALRVIWKEEGFKGFYAGISTDIKDIVLMWSLFPFLIHFSFLFLNMLSTTMLKRDTHKLKLDFIQRSLQGSFVIFLQIRYGLLGLGWWCSICICRLTNINRLRLFKLSKRWSNRYFQNNLVRNKISFQRNANFHFFSC
jgi:hypothetical protein